MFSKICRGVNQSKVILILAALVLSANIGCDRFLKGDKQNNAKADVVKIEFKEGECLKDAPKQLQAFLDDQADLNAVTSCIQKALRSFMELTRGEKADLYTSKELQEFFNEYLLKENKITSSFQKDIMKIKALVAGGNNEVATRQELEKMAVFLGEFGKVVGSLQGSVKLVALKQAPTQVDFDKIFIAQKKLHTIADYVLKNTRITEVNYQINDLILFLENLKSFLGSSKELDELFAWMPLINKTRELLIGDAARLQTQNDWLEIKGWLVNSYATFLRYHYIVKEGEFKTPETKNALIGFFDEVFEVIEKAPTLKEKKIFDAALVDAVIEEVMNRKLIKVDLSKELIQENYRKALVYFIEGTYSEGNLESFKGITSAHILGLKAEYNIWKASQNFVNRAFIEGNPQQNIYTVRDFQNRIDNKGFPLVPVNDREEYNRAWSDLRQLLNKRFVILHDSRKRQFVDIQSPNSEVNFTGISQTVLMRSAARLVLRGYGNFEERAIFKRKISQAKFIKLEADFHDFAKATGLVDPDKSTSGKETYEQGNMLVYSSNGDDHLDATELTELLATLISGGSTILDLIYQDLAKIPGCLTNRMDVFGKNVATEVCFYRKFEKEFATYFPNLPHAIRYVKSLSDVQFRQMFDSILAVAKSPRYQTGYLESSEIRTMAVILHFVEEIFLTYDADQSRLLTKNEVLDAFPRFRYLIKDNFKKMDPTGGLLAFDANLQKVFLYLVYEGKLPNGLDIVFTWANSWFGNLGEVDRLMIYKLLGTMKQILGDGKVNGKVLTSGEESGRKESNIKNLDNGVLQPAPVGSL